MIGKSESRRSHRISNVREESGKLREFQMSGEESGNFVRRPGKIACIFRLCNCCCNIVSGQKPDKFFEKKVKSWICIAHRHETPPLMRYCFP